MVGGRGGGLFNALVRYLYGVPSSLFPPSSLSLLSLFSPPSRSWLFACATAQKIVSVENHLMRQETTSQNTPSGPTESGGQPSGPTESAGQPSGPTESGRHPSGPTESGGVSLEKPSGEIKLPFKPNFDVKVETHAVCYIQC